ncbi:hypothetical protein P5673_022091 [Acropora cervicornis]|uniref:Uncharacterized protein n=1 Tax=Acropora cervicornis TaxID=6130 RepID=A0AAD9Q856_ACRCE|nr:hypothetical protein P5673_022091 [Acropora cervicornis]
MYRQVLNRMRTPLVAASVFKRNSSWTKGEGPNYSKNLIAIGAATAVGVMISTLYHRWKFDKDTDIE